MTFYVYTLGCRLNQCESEAVADKFTESGFTAAENGEEADIVIVNTCTVTAKAEQKARRMLRLYAKTCRALLVTGCYVELDEEEVKGLTDKIYTFTLSRKGDLLDIPEYLANGLNEGHSLKWLLDNFMSTDKDPFVFDAASFTYHSRAYLKIQDGCDNACGYCRTTIARGRSVSLDKEEVVRRALRLEAEGFHEIMLTGVNLTMYNHDEGGLGELVEMLLAALGPDMRIRFSSMEADHIDDRLLECIRDSRIQPHFHLPIQSASNRILKRVNRKYSIEHVKYCIEKIREYRDDPFFACDMIAGLPSETDEDHQETVKFLTDYGFAAVHVFPYSPREGTPLYSAKDHVPERIRDERAAELRTLSNQLSRRYLSRQEGKEVEILTEESKDGRIYGTTGNYIKAEIILPEGMTTKPGDLLKGRFTSIYPQAQVTVEKN